MTTALAALAGYLAGSIPFAVIVSRLMRLPDPRTYGSGNIGATNVLRSGNKLAALLTMVGDIAKGGVAVWVARLLGLSELDAAVVGFAAFVGHCFPVWLRFKGGKGVATAAGVLVALDWRLGLSVLAVWLVVVAATRYSSLGAIVAAIAAPFFASRFLEHSASVGLVGAMAVLLVVRHHANIAKLVRGEESRIGGRKAASTGEKQP
jgi:acyl phosphate:glycerol-3-phosphate acyltransferase